MASRQARVIYDFDPQSGTGEINIRVGEILQITRTDVGEGWWEGTNPRGDSGLFPEAYVEELTESDGPPAMAPPPLPQDYTAPASNTFGTSAAVDDWGSDPWAFSGGGAPPPAAPASNNQEWQQDVGVASSLNVQRSNTNSAAQSPSPGPQDDWDSDFDDESASQVGGNGNSNYAATTDAGGNLGLPTANYQKSGSTGDVSSIGRNDSKKGASGATKTSFNRFSLFVKSGGENYILGKVTARVPEMDIITVVENSEGRFCWLNSKPPYSCVIASPKKEAKFKGLKSYIAYQLTPSFNNIQVSRRYKHFDWLHERLVAKFNLLPIPPLPDKQIQGRYEEEFIEHRMNQLQSFVDRMCKHPVLSQSEVWTHFLTCTDEKRWKTGKRKAEKDPLVGGSYFTAIQTPNKPIDAEYLDREVLMFSQFSTQFDAAVRNMAKTVGEQTQKFQNGYKRDYQVVGKAFMQLGQAMEQDGGVYNAGLSNAVTATGECYEDIARLYDDQPRLDWEHLGDMMHDYRGLLSGWPAVLQMHSGAIGKSRELSGSAEAENVKTRTDTMSYALLAEVNTFHEQRVIDIKSSHQRFLQEQIKFYEKITEKLQESLRLYDQCWASQGRHHDHDETNDDSTLGKTKQNKMTKRNNLPAVPNYDWNKNMDPASELMPTFTKNLEIIDEDIYEEISH